MRHTLHRVLVALCVVAMSAVAGAAQRELDSTDRYPVEAGDRVIVDVASLNVTLRGADVAEAELHTELRISGVGEERAEDFVARHTPVVERLDDGLSVIARPGNDGFMGLGLLTARARIHLLVPRTAAPDVTTTSGTIRVEGDFPNAEPLLLRSSTGDIEMNGAATGVDIRTPAGDSRIDVMRPLEDLFARTSTGDVTLHGGTRHAHVETASGDIWLEGLSGPADVSTSSGRITLRWDRLDPEDTVRVRSTSSRITLLVPAHARPRGTLTTTGGRVRSDLPGTVNEAGDTVVLEGDGPLIEAETASGEIILEPR